MSNPKSTKTPVYIGVDVGSSHTKVAVIDVDSQLIGYWVGKSGIDFSVTAERCLSDALEMARCGLDQIAGVVSTGYGRHNVTYAGSNRTEIGCHAKGVLLLFPFGDYRNRHWRPGQ